MKEEGKIEYTSYKYIEFNINPIPTCSNYIFIKLYVYIYEKKKQSDQ